MSGCLVTTTRRGAWRWFTVGRGPLGSLLISFWGCQLRFVVLGSCFPQFATQPFRSDRGLGRAEGRTGCAGSREESESARRVAWSSLAELWEKEPKEPRTSCPRATSSSRRSSTALSFEGMRLEADWRARRHTVMRHPSSCPVAVQRRHRQNPGLRAQLGDTSPFGVGLPRPFRH